MKDLIAVGVKTHFIYHVVAKNNGYKQPLPDVLEDRPGQMDAFGIASGLVAIHTRRPDNSFMEFVRRDNPKSPIFTGFSKANGLPADVPGMTEAVTDPKAAGDRIFKNIPAWAPPVPAPIDVKSVNWATSAITPTGTATRAPRRARWRRARRPPAIRAWSTSASTSR